MTQYQCKKHGIHYGTCASCLKENKARRERNYTKGLQQQKDKLQKQSDLLTLGLLQEKNEVVKLKNVLILIYNENFSGQSTLSSYAKRQVDEVLKEKSIGNDTT